MNLIKDMPKKKRKGIQLMIMIFVWQNKTQRIKVWTLQKLGSIAVPGIANYYFLGVLPALITNWDSLVLNVNISISEHLPIISLKNGLLGTKI